MAITFWPAPIERRRPLLNESLPLFEQLTSTISCINLVTDRMCQCHLGYFRWERRSLAGPIFER